MTPKWERLLEVVERARNGDEAAKWTLVVAVETERRPTIHGKLHSREVRNDDLPDAHHEVGLRVYERIEHLRVTRAYFRFETWIISEVSRKYRDSYREAGEPLDIVLTEMDGTFCSKEACYGIARTTSLGINELSIPTTCCLNSRPNTAKWRNYASSRV
jgi:hypothetical protein